MSLINDCLEDIQERGAGTGLPEEAHVVGSVGATAPRFYERRGFVPVLVAATCILVIGAEVTLRVVPFFGQDTDSSFEVPAVSARPPAFEATHDTIAKAHVPVVSTFTPQTPVVASSTDHPSRHAEVARLSQVEVEAHGDFTRVRLHLSQERDYWIEGNTLEGEAEVVISGTRLSRAFSPQSFAGTGLFLRETHNTSDGLHLIFGVDEGSEIQSQFVDSGVGNQLILDIGSAPAEGKIVAAPRWKEPAKSEANWGSIDHTTSTVVSQKSRALESLDRARDLVAKNRPDEAIAEYLYALSIDPDLHRARERLVSLFIAAKQVNAADQHLADGIARAPQHSEYTLLRAQLLVAMKQPQRAIAILEGFPTPENRRSDALNLLAALYQQEGDHERAEALFRSAVRLAPHEGRLWMGLGISLEGQDRSSEALAVYQQAQSLGDFGSEPRSWIHDRIEQLTTVE